MEWEEGKPYEVFPLRVGEGMKEEGKPYVGKYSH